MIFRARHCYLILTLPAKKSRMKNNTAQNVLSENLYHGHDKRCFQKMDCSKIKRDSGGAAGLVDWLRAINPP
jgi:hypothetical protein